MNFALDLASVPASALRGPDAVALSTPDGLRHGYLCGQYAARAGLYGPVVECGVAAGAQAAMMARGIMDGCGSNTLYLFDSFQGIPMAGPKDADQPGIGPITHDVNAPLVDRLVSSGVSSYGMDVVRSNFTRWDIRLPYFMVPGWFQHTVPITELQNIAILRLDGDLYESTKVCLDHLYDRVADGGLIVIDDIDLPGCAAAVHDFAFSLPVWPEITMTDVGGGYHIATWIK